MEPEQYKLLTLWLYADLDDLIDFNYDTLVAPVEGEGDLL